MCMLRINGSFQALGATRTHIPQRRKMGRRQVEDYVSADRRSDIAYFLWEMTTCRDRGRRVDARRAFVTWCDGVR